MSITDASDRRRFLTLGGATVALAAVAAACGSGTEEQIPITGTAPEAGDEEGGDAVGSRDLDLNLLRTYQSIELTAVDAYEQLLAKDFVTTPAVVEAFELFKEQHGSRAETLAEATTAAGGAPYDETNEYMTSTIVEPGLDDVVDEETALAMALTLETTATQTAVYAAELLTTPTLRQVVMSVGGAEARSMAVIYGLEGQPQVPFPTMPRRNHLDTKGFVGAG